MKMKRDPYGIRESMRILNALHGPPHDPTRCRRIAIGPRTPPDKRAAAWAELREYDHDTIQDERGVFVTEAEWHHNKEEARLNKLPRLCRSEAMTVLRRAVALGGDETRRKNAWQRLRDHRVVLKTFDRDVIITEKMWRGWVAEGKFCHDPKGCVMTGVDEDYA